MANNNPKTERKTRSLPVYRRIEDVIGCKWSVGVLGAISRGIVRPGALERSIPGISTKILNERLRKLEAFGLLKRLAFDERPFRVEYHLTPFGKKARTILRQIEKLQAEIGN